MTTIRAVPPRVPHSDANAAPPTPIWISHPIQTALALGGVVLLVLTLILSYPVGELSWVMPRELA
jgi:hypothetical protein